MEIKKLLKKIRSGNCTNKEIAIHLGWEYEDQGCGSHPEGLWRKPNGDNVPVNLYSGLPNWVSNTDAALRLIPEGWVVFGLTNDPVSVEGFWLATFRRIDHDNDAEGFTLMDDTHTNLTTAILLVIFQINDLLHVPTQEDLNDGER